MKSLEHYTFLIALIFSIFIPLWHLKSIEPFFEATQFDKHQADYLMAGSGVAGRFSNHIYSLTSFVTICFIPSVIHQGICMMILLLLFHYALSRSI